MPKIKTSRAAAKRFKKTGAGKLKRNKAYNFTLFIRISEGGNKTWQELKAA